MANVMTLGVEHLRFERRGSVAWCTIDRPAARNALTSAMYIGLGEALERTTRDPDLEALVITALGDVFIPGGDVKDNSAGAKMVPSQTVPFAAFRDAVVPVVTAINGLCQASGLLFAMLSDIAIASVRATFRAPELFVGVPDTWLAALLPAHVGMSRARELVMTGRKIDATEAHAIGLVSKVVDHDQLQEAAQEIVLEILETAPEARKQWRRAANALYGAVDEETLDRATAGPEAVEGMAAFLEHRPPAWSRRASL